MVIVLYTTEYPCGCKILHKSENAEVVRAVTFVYNRELLYCSLVKEGLCMNVRPPPPPVCLEFLLRSNLYLIDHPPSVSIASLYSLSLRIYNVVKLAQGVNYTAAQLFTQVQGAYA